MSKITVNIPEGITHFKVKASESKVFEKKVVRKIKRELRKQKKENEIDYWILKENPLYSTYLKIFKKSNKWAYMNLNNNGFNIKSPEKSPNDEVNYYLINSEKILDKMGKKFFYGINAFFTDVKLDIKGYFDVKKMHKYYKNEYNKAFSIEDSYDMERSAFYRQYSAYKNIDSNFQKFLSKFGLKNGEYSIQERVNANKKVIKKGSKKIAYIKDTERKTSNSKI